MLWLAAPLSAQTTDPLGDALQTYADGMQNEERSVRIQRFMESERLFQAALSEHGPTAALWTNIGTAALQAERPGAAILAYRRALILDPAYDRAKNPWTWGS